MAQYTHWKQTVFYTGEALSMFKGDVVEGVLSCAPNEKNHRDVDIKISYTHKAHGKPVSYVQHYFLR